MSDLIIPEAHRLETSSTSQRTHSLDHSQAATSSSVMIPTCLIYHKPIDLTSAQRHNKHTTLTTHKQQHPKVSQSEVPHVVHQEVVVAIEFWNELRMKTTFFLHCCIDATCDWFFCMLLAYHTKKYTGLDFKFRCPKTCVQFGFQILGRKCKPRYLNSFLVQRCFLTLKL